MYLFLSLSGLLLKHISNAECKLQHKMYKVVHVAQTKYSLLYNLPNAVLELNSVSINVLKMLYYVGSLSAATE